MKKILLVVFVALSVVACDKDEPDTDQGTPMENLTGTGQKNWKLSFAEAKADGASLNLLTSYPCWADNILTLKADGTYEMNDSGQRCSTTDGEALVSGWVLTESPASIKLGLLKIGDIVELKDLLLEITEIKSNTFTGIVRNIQFGTIKVDTITLTFVEVK